MSDKLKLQLTKLPYIVLLSAELEVNGLGEVVTMAVKDSELRVMESMPQGVRNQVTERAEEFTVAALMTALKAYEENKRERRDSQAVAAPVHSDDGREDRASNVGCASHAGAGTEPDGGSA